MWALALAYRKNADVDDDRAKAYELEQVTRNKWLAQTAAKTGEYGIIETGARLPFWK